METGARSVLLAALPALSGAAAEAVARTLMCDRRAWPLLASSPACPVLLLGEMAVTGSPAVRRRVALNPSCPADVRDQLTGDVDATVRDAAAQAATVHVAAAPVAAPSSFAYSADARDALVGEIERKFASSRTTYAWLLGRLEPRVAADPEWAADEELLRACVGFSLSGAFAPPNPLLGVYPVDRLVGALLDVASQWPLGRVEHELASVLSADEAFPGLSVGERDRAGARLLLAAVEGRRDELAGLLVGSQLHVAPLLTSAVSVSADELVAVLEWAVSAWDSLTETVVVSRDVVPPRRLVGVYDDVVGDLWCAGDVNADVFSVLADRVDALGSGKAAALVTAKHPAVLVAGCVRPDVSWASTAIAVASTHRLEVVRGVAARSAGLCGAPRQALAGDVDEDVRDLVLSRSDVTGADVALAIAAGSIPRAETLTRLGVDGLRPLPWWAVFAQDQLVGPVASLVADVLAVAPDGAAVFASLAGEFDGTVDELLTAVRCL